MTQQHMLELRRLRLVVGFMLAVSAVASAGAELPELEASRARWSQAGVTAYRYGYNKFCECHREAPPETIVTVAQGRVVSVHHKHADSDREVPARDGSLDYYWTVDDLFALLESGLARGALVRASFNAELGYPEHVYVDYDPALVGDEVDVRLTFLQSTGQ